MIIISDQREKLPYTFDGKFYEGVEVVQGHLETGDYSIKGADRFVAVERKSAPDLLASISQGRERFETELRRGRSLEAFAVVVETDWLHLSTGNYRSKMPPHAVCQTLLAWSCRYRCQFLFAGDREQGEYMTYSFLRHYLTGKRKLLDTLIMQCEC